MRVPEVPTGSSRSTNWKFEPNIFLVNNPCVPKVPNYNVPEVPNIWGAIYGN